MVSQKIDSIEALRDAIRSLPEIVPVHKWDYHRIAIRDHILNEDPENFINWSTIQATMFVGDYGVTRDEYNEMKELLGDIIFELVLPRENWIGNPPSFSLNDKTNGNIIHQMYHINHMAHIFGEEGIEVSNQVKTYAEIGGGYGAMCYHFQWNGREGDYHSFDYPELLLLQQYYLTRSGITESVHFHDKPIDLEVDVLIAISSLSEMPIETRISYLDNIQAQYYLISYQDNFFDIDNHEFFKEYFADFNTVIIKPHPYIVTNNYLVAKR